MNISTVVLRNVCCHENPLAPERKKGYDERKTSERSAVGLAAFDPPQRMAMFEGFNPEHPLTSIVESMLERSYPNYKNEPDVKWNFTKFLVDREGNVVARFEPTEDAEVVEQAVKNLL